MSGGSWPLEPSGADMRRLVAAALDRIVAHIESLPQQPAGGRRDDIVALARSVVEPLPEGPTDLDGLLAFLFERAVPASFNTAGPGYLAYIPGGGLFHAALADLIADTTNRYVGVWAAAPALAQLEATVLDWFAEIVGYRTAGGPAAGSRSSGRAAAQPVARGMLTSGGSLANFSALVVARRERLAEDFLRGTLYVSDQGHHSIQKAAMLAGFPTDRVREIPSDGAFRIRIDELERQIAGDRAAGFQPFCIVGNAGTTNTGAVDDFEALAEVATREGLWLHADAAYGGFFLLTKRGREVMRGIERADSITLDPHKGLFLPYGTGSLLVRDGAALRRAHELTAAYLPEMQDGEEFVDFCQYSPELSRPFRGLRVWLAFKLAGAAAFREALEEKLDLARWAARELAGIPGIEIVAPPVLSTVAFRYRPEGRAARVARGDLDALNRRLLALINERQRVYLTGTTLRSGFVLRICVLSFRTHRERMEAGLEDIRWAARKLAAETSG